MKTAPKPPPTTASARLDFLHRASLQLLLSSPAIASHLQVSRRQISDANEFDSQTSTGTSTSTRVCAACGNVLIPGWTSTTVWSPGLDVKKRQRQRQRQRNRDGNVPVSAEAKGGRSATAAQAGERRKMETKKIQLCCDRCSAISSIEAEKPKRPAAVAEGKRRAADEKIGKIGGDSTAVDAEATAEDTSTAIKAGAFAVDQTLPSPSSVSSAAAAAASTRKQRSRSSKKANLQSLLADHRAAAAAKSQSSSSSLRAGFGMDLMDFMKK